MDRPSARVKHMVSFLAQPQTSFMIFSESLEAGFISVNFRLLTSINGHSGKKIYGAICPGLINDLR